MRKPSLRVSAGSAALAVLLAVGAVAAWYWWSATATGSRRPFGEGPALDFKALVELGARTNGTFVRAPLQLKSSSEQPIRLNGFGSNCGCMQVYEEVQGGRRPVRDLVLAPHEERTVFAEIRTSGEPGSKAAVVVNFQEDGAPRQVVIAYTPVARLYLVPRTLAFGVVPEGRPAELRAELRSDGSFAGKLGEITCSAPQAFAVAYRPPEAEELAEVKRRNDGQHLLGHLVVTLKPQGAGNTDRELIVFNDGREMVRLPVSGAVVGEYQLAPSELVLPRAQGAGRLCYRARISCRAHDGRRVEAEPDLEKAAPFEVVAVGAKGEPTALFEVRYTGPTPVRGAAQDYRLRFRVNGGGAEAFLTLPVKLLPSE